jgi:NAD(P)-dependent dehydrogenase (short-subunit alcohol dehydrogenase family)
MNLDGKVSLVTGSARGIGQAIALALARSGSHVVINDLLESEGREVSGEAEKLGVKSIFVRADITREEEVRGMILQTMDRLGTIDILVNSAGINSPVLVEDMSFELWKRIIEADLNSAFLCSQAVIPEMKRKCYGRIINIASVAGKRISSHGNAAYTAAKAGLIGFTRHLAFELAPWKITVNAVCPGGTLSKRILERDANLSQAERDADIKRFPLGRWGLPEDQGKAALFFASDDADFITGQALDVDGGELIGWGDCESYIKRRKQFVSPGCEER